MKKVPESVLLLIRLGRTACVCAHLCVCVWEGRLLTYTPKVPSLPKSAAIAVAAILPGVVRISHCIEIPSAFLSLP